MNEKIKKELDAIYNAVLIDTLIKELIVKAWQTGAILN